MKWLDVCLTSLFNFQFVEESKLDEAAGRDGIKAGSVPSKGSKASLRSDKSNNSEEVCRIILCLNAVFVSQPLW